MGHLPRKRTLPVPYVNTFFSYSNFNRTGGTSTARASADFWRSAGQASSACGVAEETGSRCCFHAKPPQLPESISGQSAPVCCAGTEEETALERQEDYWGVYQASVYSTLEKFENGRILKRNNYRLVWIWVWGKLGRKSRDYRDVIVNEKPAFSNSSRLKNVFESSVFVTDQCVRNKL